MLCNIKSQISIVYMKKKWYLCGLVYVCYDSDCKITKIIRNYDSNCRFWFN